MEPITTIRAQRNNKTFRFVLGDKNILRDMNPKHDDVYVIVVKGKKVKNKETGETEVKPI